MFAIGIGSKINTTQLVPLASSPAQDHVFLVTEFNKLLSFVNSVAEGTCSGKLSRTRRPFMTGGL